MDGQPRVTLQVAFILQAMQSDPDGRHYGLELAEATGLKSGTLYPILARLERAGWVASEWEDIDPRHEGRPRRRYYTLTATGSVIASRTLSDLRRRTRATQWRPALGEI